MPTTTPIERCYASSVGMSDANVAGSEDTTNLSRHVDRLRLVGVDAGAEGNGVDAIVPRDGRARRCARGRRLEDIHDREG